MRLILFLIYVVRELWIQGFKRSFHRVQWAMSDPMVIKDYYICFDKKMKAKKMPMDRRFIPMNQIIMGHPTYPSKVHKKRVEQIKRLKDQVGISQEEVNSYMPSDKPIQAVKEVDGYFLISGNGRVTALKEVGFTGKVELELFIND